MTGALDRIAMLVRTGRLAVLVAVLALVVGLAWASSSENQSLAEARSDLALTQASLARTQQMPAGIRVTVYLNSDSRVCETLDNLGDRALTVSLKSTPTSVPMNFEIPAHGSTQVCVDKAPS